MIVYHGSNQIVMHPDIVHSRKKVDFGPGFYVTPLREQAESWTRKFKRRGQEAIISCYELRDAAFETENVRRFDDYDEEWLDYIIKCRSGNVTDEFSIIMGGVANDRVFDTLELYFDGLIDKKAALERLIYEKPNYQVCLRTQEVIDRYLYFERSEVI